MNRAITDEQAAEAAAEIGAAVETFPDLTDFGFGIYALRRLTAEYTYADS